MDCCSMCPHGLNGMNPMCSPSPEMFSAALTCAALCDTATGKVCCQTTLPGTSCQPVPGEKNDQCCATRKCTRVDPGLQ